MQFGVFTFSRSPYQEIARHFRQAEEMGFDSAWVDDDLLVPEYGDLEPWSLLAALSRDTQRMQLGTMVSAIPFRPPVFLAVQAITVNLISEGRAALGLGSGGGEHRFDAFGHAAWGGRERAERLEEQAAILAPLLRGETINHTGKHYTIENVHIPGAELARKPPLVVAAHGDRALRVAARYADGWNCLTGIVFPESDPPVEMTLQESVAAVKRLSERLDEFCAEIGRDPREVRRSVQGLKSNPDPLSSLDAFDEVVGAYEEAGIDEIILYWPPVDLAFGGWQPIPRERQATYELIATERIASR